MTRIKVLRVILVLLSPTGLLGKLLPGPCPDMPPTASTFGSSYEGLVFALVPFDQTPSLIFPKQSYENILCLVLTISDGLDELSVIEPGLGRYTMGTNISVENGSLHLISGTIKYERTYVRPNLDANRTTPENLRIWVFSEIFSVLWSCREIHGGNTHDEAVMMAIFYDNQQLNKSIRMGEFKRFSRGFFGKSLVDAIEWFEPADSTDKCRESGLDGMLGHTFDVRNLAILLIFVLAWLILINIILVFCMRKNSVDVIE